MMAHIRSFSSILFLIILLSSCKVSQNSILNADSRFAKIEADIDAATSCDELQNAYVSFYKMLIADDGNVSEQEWKDYCAASTLIQKKLNRKGRKYCGDTFFDSDFDLGEPMEENDDQNFFDGDDPVEDLFDYDEFDSSR